VTGLCKWPIGTTGTIGAAGTTGTAGTTGAMGTTRAAGTAGTVGTTGTIGQGTGTLRGKHDMRENSFRTAGWKNRGIVCPFQVNLCRRGGRFKMISST